MNDKPTLSSDAGVALGLAATAMPFARGPRAELDRWLRVLSQHGETGATLGSLGVGRGDRPPVLEPPPAHGPQPTEPPAADPVGWVTDRAGELAASGGGGTVRTTDLLLAVLELYGPTAERALEERGTSIAEVTQLLGAAA